MPAAAQTGAPTMRTLHRGVETAPLSLTLEDAVRRAIDNNPELAIVRLETEVDTARIDQTRTAYTPVFSTTLGDRAPSPRRRTFCWASAASTSMTGSRRRSAAAIAVGIRHVEPFVGHVEDRHHQPADELRSHTAIGIRDRVLAALASRSRGGFGALSVLDCQAKPGQLGPPFPRGDRPDRGGGEAGLLDPEGGAGECGRARAIARVGARACA
jgi:hypothetical protein